MRAPTAANQFHAPVPRWNSRSRASSSSNGILPAAAFASTRRPGGAAAPATRSKSVRIKKMAPSGCPLHGTAIPVARRPVDWRRTIRRGGGLEGIGGAWTGHAQHQTRRVAISRAEGDGQAGRNNGVGTLESTGRVSPDLVRIRAPCALRRPWPVMVGFASLPPSSAPRRFRSRSPSLVRNVRMVTGGPRRRNPRRRPRLLLPSHAKHRCSSLARPGSPAPCPPPRTSRPPTA